MADGISFDFSELTALAADLGTVPDNAGPNVRKAVEFTSVEVKKSAAKKVTKRRHFRQAAAAIGFDVTAKAGATSSITSEIGYDKGRPSGKLGNLVEFGAPGSPNALTPGNELVSSLHENEADFQKGLERALADAERKAGL